MEVSTIPIRTKLEGPKNWNMWKFQVRLALGTNGLMGNVDRTQGKPGTNAASKDVDAWVAKNKSTTYYSDETYRQCDSSCSELYQCK